MTEPIEEIVARIVRWIDDPMVADDEFAIYVRALIASWRERGEALQDALVFVCHAQYWATGIKAQRIKEKNDAVALEARIKALLAK